MAIGGCLTVSISGIFDLFSNRYIAVLSDPPKGADAVFVSRQLLFLYELERKVRAASFI